LERDGDDVHGRAYAAARAKPPHQLVRRPEVDVPGYLVGVPVCGVNAARSVTNQFKSATSLTCQLLEQSVEIFEACVLDDDFAPAVVVFNVDLEAEGAL